MTSSLAAAGVSILTDHALQRRRLWQLLTETGWCQSACALVVGDLQLCSQRQNLVLELANALWRWRRQRRRRRRGLCNCCCDCNLDSLRIGHHKQPRSTGCTIEPALVSHPSKAADCRWTHTVEYFEGDDALVSCCIPTWCLSFSLLARRFRAAINSFVSASQSLAR